MKELGEFAVRKATQGAVAYLQKHNLKADDKALAESLSKHVKAAIPQALTEAEEALNSNMPGVAEQTFAASMVLAGIAAAKECGVSSDLELVSEVERVSKMESQWVDRAGSNYSKSQVVEILKRSMGASDTIVDHVRVGGVYSNGGIWFQRIS